MVIVGIGGDGEESRSAVESRLGQRISTEWKRDEGGEGQLVAGRPIRGLDPAAGSRLEYMFWDRVRGRKRLRKTGVGRESLIAGINYNIFKAHVQNANRGEVKPFCIRKSTFPCCSNRGEPLLTPPKKKTIKRTRHRNTHDCLNCTRALEFL